jgi:subtilisin family serine protease
VAVVSSDPDGISSLSAAAEGAGPILAVEPERIMYAVSDLSDAPPAGSREYVRGYGDGVENLVRALRSLKLYSDDEHGEQQAAAVALDESQFTWGLQAIRANASTFLGAHVPVAILDTGLDLNHPDFRGRSITTHSFISGQPVQDGNGHGTHCTGTSTGTSNASIRPRYGVASRANIFIGKVLNNAGSGADGGILAGIEWALANHCRVVSMSLGAPVQPGEPPSPVYEALARRCLQQNLLIIAAAGNDSDRARGVIRPVSRPANCASIAAVAALDSALRVANFSNGGVNPAGGQIDVAGPGVDVYSSWPMPTRYRRLSGTSMATPHVAGVAAQFIEANPRATASEIWALLVRHARRLPLLPRDVGAGLVQCP